MYPLIQLETSVSCGRDRARSLPSGRAFLLIPLILVNFAFLSQMQAAPNVSPPPDGCYPGFTTAEGCSALQSLTTGAGNTAVGWYSLFLDSTGSYNSALGGGALILNNADSNTAVGAAALLLNNKGAGANSGTENVAVGTDALVYNAGNADADSGSYNDAFGAFALFSNTDGYTNNAFGNHALFENIHGAANTAVGDLALQDNDSSGDAEGNINTAVGAQALRFNINGDSNNAVGYSALQNNTDGVQNNAMGVFALLNNAGGGNTAVGDSAFADNVDGSFNTVVGWGAGGGVEGSDNIYVGATAGPPGPTPPPESGTIRIGDPGFITGCWIAGISGATSTGGSAVFVNAGGKLGTLTSSARFKDDIKPMNKASESLFALSPVTFHYKKEIDANGTPQFGLVAEEVAKVNPDLVINDPNGKPYTVRYEAVNAMLLNEFLKEHGIVQKQQATIALQESQIKALIAGLREQATQIQKVSAQLEMIKPAPQVVENR